MNVVVSIFDGWLGEHCKRGGYGGFCARGEHVALVANCYEKPGGFQIDGCFCCLGIILTGPKGFLEVRRHGKVHDK